MDNWRKLAKGLLLSGYCALRLTLGLLVLFAALSAGWTLPAFAESAQKVVIKGGQVELKNAEKYVAGVICYQEDAAFLMVPPEGWVGDPAAANQLGLCGVFYPVDYDFNTAPAVMYPRLMKAFPGDSLEDRAQKQAEFTLRKFRALPGGQGLILRKEKAYTAGGGLTFALRRFDNGPPPNVAEAAAYAIHNDAIFIVVLSAKSAGQLSPYLPALYAALDEVAAMDCVVEP